MAHEVMLLESAHEYGRSPPSYYSPQRTYRALKPSTALSSYHSSTVKSAIDFYASAIESC